MKTSILVFVALVPSPVGNEPDGCYGTVCDGAFVMLKTGSDGIHRQSPYALEFSELDNRATTKMYLDNLIYKRLIQIRKTHLEEGPRLLAESKKRKLRGSEEYVARLMKWSLDRDWQVSLAPCLKIPEPLTRDVVQRLIDDLPAPKKFDPRTGHYKAIPRPTYTGRVVH